MGDSLKKRISALFDPGNDDPVVAPEDQQRTSPSSRFMISPLSPSGWLARQMRSTGHRDATSCKDGWSITTGSVERHADRSAALTASACKARLIARLHCWRQAHSRMRLQARDGDDTL
jgi:hypothetical protein